MTSASRETDARPAARWAGMPPVLLMPPVEARRPGTTAASAPRAPPVTDRSPAPADTGTRDSAPADTAAPPAHSGAGGPDTAAKQQAQHPRRRTRPSRSLAEAQAGSHAGRARPAPSQAGDVCDRPDTVAPRQGHRGAGCEW